MEDVIQEDYLHDEIKLIIKSLGLTRSMLEKTYKNSTKSDKSNLILSEKYETLRLKMQDTLDGKSFKEVKAQNILKQIGEALKDKADLSLIESAWLRSIHKLNL